MSIPTLPPELHDLLDRLEAAAHELPDVAAAIPLWSSPDDRKYYAERMLALQADLQRLRPLIEDFIGNTNSKE